MSFLKKAQQQIAHNTVAPSLIGNSDLKTLQAVITTEKEFIKTNTKIGTDFAKSNDALRAWAEDEGPDLRDVLSKVSVLWESYPSSVQRFNAHLSTIRLHYKAVRTREETLSEMKSRKRSLASKIESVEKKLAKMSPENKELMKTTSQLKELRNEMSGLSHEVVVEESALEDFKRRSFKEALALKCSAMVEMAEKMIVMSEMAGAMLEELDIEPAVPGQPRRAYQGEMRTEELLQDGIRCLADVAFRPINTPATAGGAGAPDARPSHMHHQFSASEVTNAGMYPGYPPQVGQQGPGNESSLDHRDGVAERDFAAHDSNVNGYAGHPGDWDPQNNIAGAGAGYGQFRNAAPQQQQQGGQGAWGSGAQVPVNGPADAPADDWGKQAMGAISGAGEEVKEEPVTIPPATGSANAHEASTSAIGASSGAPASPRAATQPAAPERGDSTEELSKDYGMLTTSGAPIIANDTSTSTPIGHQDHAAYAGQGEGDSAAGAMAPADEEYFKSVGSTRAAQAAVKRPSSAQGGGAPARYSSYGGLSNADASFNSAASAGAVPGSASTVPPPAPSAGAAMMPAEDASGVKKVTAGAFRKGFTRNASSQSGIGGVPGPGSRPSSALGHRPGDNVAQVGTGAIAVPVSADVSSSSALAPGAGDDAMNASHLANTSYASQNSVAPLHITKRASQDMGRNDTILSRTSGHTDAAPPYTSAAEPAAQGQAQAPRLDNPYAQSVYGGMAPTASSGGYTDPNAPAPGQYSASSSYQQHGAPSAQAPPAAVPPASQAYGYPAASGYPASAGQPAPAAYHPQQHPPQPAYAQYGYPQQRPQSPLVQAAQGAYPGYTAGYADPYAAYGQQPQQRYANQYGQR